MKTEIDALHQRMTAAADGGNAVVGRYRAAHDRAVAEFAAATDRVTAVAAEFHDRVTSRLLELNARAEVACRLG